MFARTTNRVFSRIALSIALFVGLAATANAASKANAAPPKGPSIVTWTTPNGANVLFVAANEIPMVDIRVVFDAGSARDNGKGGLALLTNGLLSEGAGDWDSTAIAKRFESVGANFGNGSYRDMAVVTLRSLADAKYFTPALETFTTVLQKPTFPADALERERNRLLISIKSEKESLGDLADDAFYKAIYGDHPYAANPKGTEKTVPTITRDDLAAFYKQYYVAKNAVIAIVGDLDKAKAEKIADQIAGAIQPGEHAADLPNIKPLDKANTVRIDHPSQQTHLMVGQPGMRRDDPDFYPLYLGNHILGGSGLVSRMADEIREKRGLSYSQYSYFAPMRLEGPYIMGLQTRNDQAQQALDLVNQLLKDYRDKGPTAKELEAAKKNITAGFWLKIDSNADICEYLAMIGFYKLPLDYLDQFNARIEAVTADQIRDAYERRISPDKLITVIAGGSSTAQAAAGKS